MLPPHAGHLYLVEFAARRCRRLYVVVEHLAGEPIASALRVAWMRELVPANATVLHLDRPHPQAPSEHPDFWDIWRSSLLTLLPEPPDVVFASEAYGTRLAAELGARFCPVDPGRQVMPISGTEIRADPLGSFRYLPAPVRAHFVRRVSVFGPESTGKSTLARRLAEHFGTLHVPEYARTYIEAHDGALTAADMPRIAAGQVASEEVLARRADRVLLCDTDPLATPLWSEALFGVPLPAQQAEARARTYPLTLLCDADVPWVADPVRYLPGAGRDFFDRCVAELAAAGRRTVVLRGPWAAREAAAVAAIEALLAEPVGLAPWPPK
jgi:NadR type nicotinamide-nucleotide adenylyltransferase